MHELPDGGIAVRLSENERSLIVKRVLISDITMKQKSSAILTFKEKIELVKMLDRLGTDIIEVDAIRKVKADSLCIKSLGDAVKNSIIAVPAASDKESIDITWEALSRAAHPRIQIEEPVSLVQMEYILHAKPAAVKERIKEAVSYAASYTGDVEFLALDATRSERAFLYEVLGEAIAAGASTVTVCDTAGLMLPEEFRKFIKEVRENVPGLEKVSLGVVTSDTIAMADACSVEAVIAGADELKTAIHPDGTASLDHIAGLLALKGEECGASTGIRNVEMKRIRDRVFKMFHSSRSKNSPFDDGVREADQNTFTINDSIEEIVKETQALGYDLSEEDQLSVYEAFRRIAGKKEYVTSREIDAIVASSAMQVPEAYKLEDYIINGGHTIGATSRIRLIRNGKIMESVAIGDGPVDASILAIEQIIGRHYELDDFQIQAVTQEREAMGETVVRLRSEGKVYSGRGLSTDIIGSSIRAYVNALNKIVYEEENA